MKKAALVIFMAGWVFPLMASLYLVIAFLRLEVSPVVYGTPGQLNSFPFLAAAQDVLTVAVLWGLAALVSGIIFYVRK